MSVISLEIVRLCTQLYSSGQEGSRAAGKQKSYSKLAHSDQVEAKTRKKQYIQLPDLLHKGIMSMHSKGVRRHTVKV